ncbi:MAG: stage II sporulation protein M, partial [Acidimicrobiia bacterium]
DLARARSRYPSDPVTQKLEQLAVGARQLVYDSERKRRGVISFLATGYWQLIRSRPGPLMASLAVLLAPALLAALWSWVDPAAATGLVPAQFQGVLDGGSTNQGLSLAEQSAFSAYLMTHNTQVAITAFSAGILWCLGTVWIIAQNGLLLGAVGGLLVQSGEGGFFLELVAAHGVLELSGIAVAGAAGLRMGWALVDPGRRRRREALTEEARKAVLIVLGTIPVFIVAGLIEAFVSRSGFSATPMVIVGLLVGGAYWGLVFWRGRSDSVRDDQTLASALASM